MMDQPSIIELVDAVRSFLETKAMPELKGHTAFHARVAANALGIVSRELTQGGGASDSEHARLRTLLNRVGTLNELNRALCDALRTGNMDLDSPELKLHLERTTIDKVAIDQPGYSGLRIARGN